MARTTLNLDDPILRDLRRLQKEEGKSLGKVASEVLAEGLAQKARGKRGHKSFPWVARKMGARVDLADKDAVFRLLDEEPPRDR